MGKLHIGVDFFLHQHKNGRVLVFEVASRPIGLPIQVDGIAWWYHGDSLIPMPEEIRRAIYSESDHDFSGEICRGATIDDLDGGAIEKFRKKWVEYSGNLRIANSSVKHLLRDCGAITDDGVTYAALILFGKRTALVKHLPHSEIVFEYRSTEAAGPAAQREDFCMAFFNSYDRIWELVNLRNDKQHYQDGLHIFPISTFNEQVVREGLLNAVTHRNYQMGGSIFVRQYSRRIVIESPGGFPWGITADNILDKHSARNKLITGIFQLCGLVERAGQGMNMMYEIAIKEAKPLPDFTGSDPYFVKLTLNGKIIDSHMLTLIKKIGNERLDKMTTDDYVVLGKFYRDGDIRDMATSQFDNLIKLGIIDRTEHGFELANGDLMLLTDDNVVDEAENEATNVVDDERDIVKDVADDAHGVVDNLHGVVDDERDVAKDVADDAHSVVDNLHGVVDDAYDVVDSVDNAAKVLSFTKENPNATTKQIAEALSIGERRVQGIIKKLKESNSIRRIGSDRYGHWEIIE